MYNNHPTADSLISALNKPIKVETDTKFRNVSNVVVLLMKQQVLLENRSWVFS